MARLAVAVVVATLLAGCYGGSSSPTPGDMTDVQGALEANGATIKDVVAGEAGCADQTLTANARKLSLTLASDGKSYEVYLFRWKDQSTWSAAASPFYRCVSDFAGKAGASVHVDTVELSPWRAYGPDWTKQLHDAVQQALAQASTGR